MKPGWFVSTLTKLNRYETKAQAMVDVRANRAAGRGVSLIRECDCGCGQPAGHPVQTWGEDAFKGEVV